MDTRIGHAARESAAAVLAAALREDRIDLAEYERRLVVVQAARVRDDLVPVLADLPGAQGGPGLRISTVEREQALGRLAEALTDGRLNEAEYAGAEELLRRAVTYADVDGVVGGLDARASVAERGQAIERIDAADADGLLAPAERVDLVVAAQSATTDEQLEALTADLATAGDRASNADREAAVARLQAAMRDGLLDLTEFDERVRTAYAARRRDELAKLVADLPEPAGYRPPLPVRLARSGTAVVVLAAGVLVVAGLSVVAAVLCAAWSIWLAAGVTRMRTPVAVPGPPQDERPREVEERSIEEEPVIEEEPSGARPRLLQGHESYIVSLTGLVLPDGTPVAISGAHDNTAIVWDLANASRRHTLSGHTHDVVAVDAMVLPDGSPVAVTASADRTARVWDLRDGSLREKLVDLAPDTESVGCLTLPDGTPAAVFHAHGVIQLWDLRHGRLLRRFDYDDFYYGPYDIVPVVLDGEPVAVVPGTFYEYDERDNAHTYYALEVVSLVDGAPKARLNGHTDHIAAIDVAVLPDGTAVAVSASSDKTVRVWDLRRGSLLHTFTGMIEPQDDVSCVTLPDGTPIVVACVSYAEEARVWNLRDGSELGTFELQGSRLAGVSLPDQTLVVCANHDELAVRSLFQAGGSTVL